MNNIDVTKMPSRIEELNGVLIANWNKLGSLIATLDAKTACQINDVVVNLIRANVELVDLHVPVKQVCP